MSKYTELFNKRSAAHGSQTPASSTSSSPTASPSSSTAATGTSSSSSSSSGTSGSISSAGHASAAPATAGGSSPRHRLVHRRRGNAAAAAAAAAPTTPAPPAAAAVAPEAEGATASASSSPLTPSDRVSPDTLPHAEVQEDSSSSATAATSHSIDDTVSGGLTDSDDVDDNGMKSIDELDDDADDHDDDGFSSRSAPSLFTCDACLHFVTSSYADLVQHALRHHGDSLADYSRLRTVAEKLVPVWPQVQERKRSVIQQWGRHMFAVAARRDAGPDKMAEAHRARAQLEVVVRRWQPNARVFIFGSSVAFGVWDGISDIDFTVVDVAELEAGLWPPLEKTAVRTLTELLRRAGFSFVNLEPIAHARVPILKHHASLPIRLTDGQRRRLREAAVRHAKAVAAGGAAPPPPPSSSSASSADTTAASSLSPASSEVPAETEMADDDTQLEAELVIARSVRYTLNLPASPLDSALLEASIRLAVGSAAVQQVWWNRTREMCCVTLDTTTNAIKAATCPLHFSSAGMRARVQPLHEEYRPELYGMDFDLSFRTFGIRNSLLLRRYLLSHPCARPGALVLKDWSKSSGVNNSVNGYLTSYAINILWIYYLVHHNVIPYVSPTEDIPASLRGNVSGDPDYAALVDPAWTEAERAAMESQAGELLLGFFYYYAFEFDWETNVVSLNKPTVTTKASLGWDVEDAPMGITAGAAAAAAAGGGGGGLSGDGALFTGGGGSVLHGHDAAGGGATMAPQHEMAGGPASGTTNTIGGGAAASSLRRNRATTRYSFCIEDPYEDNLNLGRHMGVTKTLRVQTEFYRGLLSLLKDDVQHCCVFAGSSVAEEKKNTTTTAAAAAAKQKGGKRDGRGRGEKGGDGIEEGMDAVAGQEPAELPLRVLYRLMAVATREMAVAQSAHAARGDGRHFCGVPLHHLTAALSTQAPAEWKVATGAWNVHQLLHRMGLKIHSSSMVLPRREVGPRQQLAAQAPEGVVFSTAPEPQSDTSAGEQKEAAEAKTAAAAAAVEADAGKADAIHSPPRSVAEVSARNERFLRGVPSRTLPLTVMVALARGYELLTPQWVAWSKPWAALSVWWSDRQHATPRPSPSSPSSQASLAAVPPTPPQQHARPVSAAPAQAVGALRQTRKQLAAAPQWRSGTVRASAGAADAVTRRSPRVAPVGAASAAVKPRPAVLRMVRSLLRP